MLRVEIDAKPDESRFQRWLRADQDPWGAVRAAPGSE
jgi:hypothetical protein